MNFETSDQMCTDIKDQVDVRFEKLPEITRDRSERNDRLVARGASVRDYAMDRKSCRSASEVVDDSDVEKCSQKKTDGCPTLRRSAT